MELRPYQIAAVDALRKTMAQGFRRIILSSPTGSGKCLGYGTMVLMANGTSKEVQEVIPGDRLMGPDGKPRNVLSICTGRDQLYQITPVKGNPYVVNSVHLLSLKKRIEDAPTFIEAKDFYSLKNSNLKGWRPYFSMLPELVEIEIKEHGWGDYYGFELDGDKQFLLGDWQVTHNTEMSFEIIRGAQSKGKKVAFVANRIHLVDQTCRRLAQSGFTYGVIQGQNTKSPWSSVLVCSIQTLKSRGCPEDIDLFVIDECHSCAGTTAYHEIMTGKPVIGLTATPYSKGLGKHYDSLGGPLFERIVIAARIEDLIRDGYLVSADIWAPAEPDLTGVKITAGDYNEKQLGEAVDKSHLIGDIVTHWFKIANNTSTVIFATNISHSKHIVEQFQSAGVKAEHLDCYSSDEERQAILERVSRGETRVISNVGVLAEGWDFPACETLILARPTKSLIRYLQMAGRVLRPFPGKNRATILDHSGVVRRLGFPWDYFGQHLDDGKPKSGSKEPERKEPLPKPCPQCHFMKPPKTLKCPACGFEATRPSGVETEDGELVPLTKKTKGIPALEDIGRTHVYQQLIWYAQEHGYKESWAAHKYKTAFGCWPNGISKQREPLMGVVLSWIRSEQIKWAKSKANEKAPK